MWIKSPSVLAKKLARNYEDDVSKVHAIAYWIAKNIKYDYKAYLRGDIHGKSSIKVLKKRKAICGEYSQLFKEMCDAVGVKAEVVSGYTRKFDLFTTDHFYNADHAWSIVKIDSTWNLMDITWASGYVTPKKQYIDKFLWLIIRRPYHTESKYVHDFDQNWFYVKPQEMIETHYPASDIFQLLSESVPIDTFIQGGSAVPDYVDQHLIYRSSSDEVYFYNQLDELNRWEFMAESSQESNAFNRRMAGYEYYKMAAHLNQEYLDLHRNKMMTSEEHLTRIQKYSSLSDSLLTLSLEDNERDYETYSSRSLQWKNDLKATNKAQIKKFRTRKKLNSRQSKLIEKTILSNESYIKGISKTSGVPDVLTSQSDNPPYTDPEYVQSKIELIDSLLSVGKGLLAKKDSLLTVYSEEDQMEQVSLADSVFNIHKRNFNSLKDTLNQKKRDRPLVYFHREAVEKKWFLRTFSHGDSLSQTEVYPFLSVSSTNLRDAQKLMDQYTSFTIKALNTIQKVHNTSVIGFPGQTLFSRINDEYHKASLEYTEQVKSYLTAQKRIKKTIQKESKILKRSEKKLKADIAMEHYRHQIYKDHRKQTYKSEKRRIRHFLAKVKRINMQVDRTMAKLHD